MSPVIAVQLYTLRDACDQDFAGVLERVARIGYRAVQVGNFHGLSARELKKILDDCSLHAIAGHFGYDAICNKTRTVMEDAHALGMRYVVCPFIDEQLRQDAAGYRRVAAALQVAGPEFRENGLKLCYHHHAFEFEKFDGKSGIRWLMDETDPESLGFEIDTYWVKEGGEEPADFIREAGSRCNLLHLKDRAPDGRFAEVGSGTLNFPAIFSAGKEVGARAWIVEQDVCPRDPFECIEASLKYLHKQGFK